MKNKAEQLIEQAVLRAFLEDRKSWQLADASVLSPDFKERILRLADAPPEKQFHLNIRKCLLLVAVILLMLCCLTGMVAYPTVSAHIGYRKTEHEKGTDIETYPTGSYLPDSIGTHYTLREIPDGYTEYYSMHGRWESWFIWVREGTNCAENISIMQDSVGAMFIISTEGCTQEEVVVRGYKGLWYHRENFSCLFWVTDDCAFYMDIAGPDANTFDILAMANALVPADVKWDEQ